LVKNERKTENLVRDSLRALGYYDDKNDVQVEEQKSNIDTVKRLLKAASKSGLGGIGSPEFIISSPSTPDILLIIECKASTKDHDSPIIENLLSGEELQESAEQSTKRITRFAADGALHYAKFLSKDYTVIALAISGETKSSAIISTFLFTRNAKQPKRLLTKGGQNISKFIPWRDYIEHATFDPAVQKLRFDELMAFSRELHDFMRDHAKLTESEKPLLVSGTLIALRNKGFIKAYGEHSPEELQQEWMRVIKAEIHKADIPKAKKDTMSQPYSSIAVHPELSKSTKAYPKGVLHELVRRLYEGLALYCGTSRIRCCRTILR
jgi:hypothetical protein